MDVRIALVKDARAKAVEMIDHAIHRTLIARNDARGEDDRIIGFDANALVIFQRHARKCRERFALRSRGQNDALFGRIGLDRAIIKHNAIAIMEAAQFARDLLIALNAVADNEDFSPHLHGGIDGHLHAIDGG